VRTNFDVKVNRKARKAAFRAALSDHAARGTLALLDGAAFTEPSTKKAAELLSNWGQEFPTLVVVREDDDQIVKSFRNLERVLVITPGELEVAAIVWARALLVTEGALDEIQRRASA
jgi:large subunit ribosomal protein L4